MLQRIANTRPASPDRDGGRARPSLGRWSVAGPLLCLALMLALGGASVWQAWSNRQSLAAAGQSRQALLLVQHLLASVEDAETGQRGYLLTNDPSYLAPYQTASASLPGLLRELSGILPGNADAAALDQAIGAKLAEVSRIVGLAQRGDREAAIAAVSTSVGLQTMRAVRRLIDTLDRRLNEQLTRQVQAVTQSDRMLVAIQVIGLAIIALLGGLMLVGLRSSIRTLNQARDEATAAYAALERSNDRLDEQVRARTAALTAANEEIQRFAYIVSHDLRAPLVNIMGFTGELEQASHRIGSFIGAANVPDEVREAITEEVPEALRFIKASTSKMDRLINAILKLSREGRRVLTAERLDMAALFRTMVDTMTHQATSSDTTVQIAALPDVVADRLAVEQIFSNLVDNALKYLRPGQPGLITIAGRTEGAMAAFDIADNGRGIAERDFDRVFDLFRRAGDQTVPGEGIGLAHVRALVRRLGGSITCRSALGIGTTFTVRLPLHGTYAREALA